MNHSRKNDSGELMAAEKVLKKLPEEILTLIDGEAFSQGITREEAIRRLISVLVVTNQEQEIEQLRSEIKNLQKIINLKEEEVAYLRGELGHHTRGLSKLADTAFKTRTDEATVALLHSLEASLHDLKVDNISLQTQFDALTGASIDKHLPMIIIGILSALLVLYLILGKM